MNVSHKKTRLAGMGELTTWVGQRDLVHVTSPANADNANPRIFLSNVEILVLVLKQTHKPPSPKIPTSCRRRVLLVWRCHRIGIGKPKIITSVSAFTIANSMSAGV